MHDPWQVLRQIRWQDAVDIGLITLVLSRIYAWLRGTLAIQVAFSMLTLLLGAFVARELGMVLTSYLLQGIGAVATLIAVVIFRDEIRRALWRANPLSWWKRRRGGDGNSGTIAKLVDACVALARRRVGALIVLPRREPVSGHLQGGTRIDAELSPELLGALFSHTSPLHDGAVVIDDGRVALAGGVLPLSTADLPGEYGTRHRAAVGLSERCDAVVLCVSEERGEVSSVVDGRIRRIDSPARAARDLAARMQGARARTVSEELAGDRGRRRFLRDLLAHGVIVIGVFSAWYTMAGDRFHVIARTVPIEFRGLKDDLALEPPRQSSVLVELRGSTPLLSSLPPGSVTAWVDLSRASPGDKRLPVQGSAPEGVKVVSVMPTEIELHILERKTLPVQVILTADFPHTVEVAGVAPPRVEVVGDPRAFAGVKAIRTVPIGPADVDGKEAKTRLRLPLGLRLGDQRQQTVVVTLRAHSPPAAAAPSPAK